MYGACLSANPLDARFCPVHWLLQTLAIGRERAGDDIDGWLNGPVIPKQSAKTYNEQLKKLFKAAGVPKYSSHSFRRSGAMFAGRCGVDITDVRDIGRWVTLRHVGRYITEGKSRHDQLLVEHGGDDPIYKFWVYNKLAKLDGMEMTSEMLNGNT